MRITPATRALTLGVLLTAAVAPAALAQSLARPEFGLRHGGVLAPRRGADPNIGDDATDWEAGLAVGAFVRFPLTQQFAVQPELLFKQEGGSVSETFSDDEAEIRVETEFRMSYLQLPVLFAYEAPLQARVRPILYAGPYVGYAVHRSIDFDVEGTEDLGVGFSIDADDVFEAVNYGAVFGADLGFPLAGRRFTAGLRYDLGLANVFKNDPALLEDEEGTASVVEPEARTSSFSAVLSVTL
ncbi:MAG: porin family protein [Rhodothermales bacterium]|nr:porin family protein [Rhodothermales bacterium]